MAQQVNLDDRDLGPIRDFVQSIQIRQSVNQSMDFFRQAEFLLSVVRMPDDDFETLCRLARQLAHRGCSEINNKLRNLPQAARELAQELGLIPKPIDSTDIMRYISEAEHDLRKLRKDRRGKD